MNPSKSQQWAAAYAPKPFALASFLSSSFLVYHLVVQRPEKRRRLYHRLVLWLHLSQVPLSLAFLVGTLAMPRDLVVGAKGSIESCTLQGFVVMSFLLSVPFYYASLGVVSFLAVKHRFQEERYRWVEKWVHVAAVLIPLSITVLATSKQAMNPRVATCFIGAAPLGCEHDPQLPCERGGRGVFQISVIVALGQVFLYFVVPLAAMLAVCRIIARVQRQVLASRGIKHVIESAKSRMLSDVAVQIKLYLFSFWITYVFTIVGAVYRNARDTIPFNLFLLGDCFLALQGAILTWVYFDLQRRNRSHQVLPRESLRHSSIRHPTVSDIRTTAQSKSATATSNTTTTNPTTAANPTTSHLSFSIFDGVPSEDSPWAQFINDTGEDSSLEDDPEMLPANDAQP